MKTINGKKKHLILVGIILSLIVIIVLGITLIIPNYYYSQGIKRLNAEKYSKAIEFFELANSYKDSEEKIVLSTKALHYSDGVSAISNNNYSDAVKNLILADDYPDAQQKLQDVADKALDLEAWNIAILAFDNLPNSVTNDNRFYALGMKQMEKKNFIEALNNFKKSKTVEGVTQKITEANFNQGFQYFSSKNFESALNYFKKSKNYKNAEELIIKCSYEVGKIEFDKENYESAINYFNDSSEYLDSEDWLNKTNFMIAEKKLKDRNYKISTRLYKTLPNDFSFDGVSVADRLKEIDLYNFFANYEGTYNCTYGYRLVQQSWKDMSYGFGYRSGWRNNDKDGTLRISVKLNPDGTLTLNGYATGYRFSSYCVVSAGVHSRYISVNFSLNISSKSLPKVLYNEKNITIKNTGGKNFTFSYYRLDRNEDIYFNYKYISNYKFSK